MKHWINSHYKTLIISAFLIPIITVAIVSISHVTQWYGISNPISWAIYLSVGIEIAAMSALAAISANMGKNVYFPFIIVTLIQFIGNIFFAYEYIDMTSKMFQSWVELVSPLVGFMGVEPTDLIGHKRFLALFAGGLLPVISLSFLHMLVKFTEEDRLKDIKEDEEIHHKVVEEKIKHDIEETVTVDPDQLRNLVEDAVRVKLSEKDLEILEKTLLNPPPPNEALVKAAQIYNDGVNDGVNEKNDGVNDEKDRLKIDEKDLDKIEKFLTKKYEDPYDKELEEEFSQWDVTLQDGLEDEPPYVEPEKTLDEKRYEEYFVEPDDYVEPVKPSVNDEFSSLYHIEETKSSDNLPIEVEEPSESSDNLPIEEFDGDLMDDYYPMKFENDYFIGSNEQPEEILSEREQFMNEIYDEIIEEDKKKDQLESPSQEESTQSLLLEETQDLTNDDNSVYFEQDTLNPANINRKILSRNVNNTRRRGF